jgi:chromosome segregation ATPase
MTAIQMRNAALKEIDMDCNKRMSYIEYALWKYKHSVKELLARPQGENKAEIERAEAMLREVQRLFAESEKRADEAQKALREAEARETDARNKEAEAKTREAEAKTREVEAAAAKAELEVALADLNAQQKEYDDTTADLKAKSEQGGQVAQNKAKAELAQHLNKPTLALSRARITQEAAVKKAERARVAATEAKEAAIKARKDAEEATRQAVAARDKSHQAKLAADAAVEEARAKVDEAEAFLQEVKAKPGGGQGSIWWMERELHEARAFLPERKGGYKKEK